MAKNKKSVGFRMGEDYWVLSTSADEFNKKTKKTKKK